MIFFAVILFFYVGLIQPDNNGVALKEERPIYTPMVNGYHIAVEMGAVWPGD